MTDAPPKRVKRDISGWIILDKPYDMSSTEAVGKVRWLLAAKKAGHAGTLDPLATGILPIALGEATKTVPQVQDGTKVYHCLVRWGVATKTDDAEGAVTATSDMRPTLHEIEAVLPQFTGTIMQVPPAFSAIKVAGERAYDLARAGEDVQLQARPVTIDGISVLADEGEHTEFAVVCGKGTYVRALARDMALALGTVAHLARLRRTAVGSFDEARAISVTELEAMAPETRDAVLQPVSAGLADVPEIRLDATGAATVRHGNPVLLRGTNAPIALEEAWASHAGEAVAIGYVERGQFHPRRVFVSAG